MFYCKPNDIIPMYCLIRFADDELDSIEIYKSFAYFNYIVFIEKYILYSTHKYREGGERYSISIHPPLLERLRFDLQHPMCVVLGKDAV